MIKRLFRRYTLVKVCVVYFLFIFVLHLSNIIKDQVYPELEGKTINCIGTVCLIEEKTGSYGETSISIGLKPVYIKDNQLAFKGILVTLKSQSDLPQLGEKIEVTGTVQNFKSPRNPGEFNGLSYYRALGYNVRVKSASILRRNCQKNSLLTFLFKLRCHMANTLDRVCGLESGIMKSIVLGDKTDLNSEQKQLFIDGGIGHIIAISGLHISFFGIGLYKLLRAFSIDIPTNTLNINGFYIPKFICIIVSIATMCMYCILTGGSPSAIRATIMFVMSLIAELIGRSYDRITAVGFAAGVLCVIEPRLLFQSSFLMSFGAIIGITFIYPMLANLWNNFVFNCFAISLSVTLAILPVQLSSYYQFPIYSFLLNLIVVPLMGLVMLSGIGAIIFGEMNIPLGYVAFFPGHLCIGLFQWLCEFQDTLPGNCVITGKPEYWQILLYYIMIGILLLLTRYEYHSNTTLCSIQGFATKPVVLSVLTVAIIVISRVWIFHPYLYAMDVGQGDWLIFRDRYNHTITIDGGSSSESKLYEHTMLPALKALGVRKIDYMIFSHTDNDHVSGSLELLKNIPIQPVFVDRIILPPKWASYGSENYSLLTGIATKNHIPVLNLSKGVELYTGELSFKVLWPDEINKMGDINGDSLVIRADITESENTAFSVLLTGDLDGEAEEQFAKHAQNNFPELVDIDVLKVGHHGSKTSASEVFLKLISPKISIVSVGKNNYGHPNKDTIDRLREHTTMQLYSTKENGAVKLEYNRVNRSNPQLLPLR